MKMSVWMPDIVLKPVKTNMKASPRRNTFSFFTWRNTLKRRNKLIKRRNTLE